MGCLHYVLRSCLRELPSGSSRLPSLRARRGWNLKQTRRKICLRALAAVPMRPVHLQEMAAGLEGENLPELPIGRGSTVKLRACTFLPYSAHLVTECWREMARVSLQEGPGQAQAAMPGVTYSQMPKVRPSRNPAEHKLPSCKKQTQFLTCQAPPRGI